MPTQSLGHGARRRQWLCIMLPLLTTLLIRIRNGDDAEVSDAFSDLASILDIQRNDTLLPYLSPEMTEIVLTSQDYEEIAQNVENLLIDASNWHRCSLFSLLGRIPTDISLPFLLRSCSRLVLYLDDRAARSAIMSLGECMIRCGDHSFQRTATLLKEFEVLAFMDKWGTDNVKVGSSYSWTRERMIELLDRFA